MNLIRAALNGHRARRDLAKVLHDAFSEPPTILRVIKDGPTSRVAEGHWQGRAVIIKQFHTPTPEPFIADMTREHRRLSALFPHYGLNVALMCAHSAAHGIALLDKAPGLRLDAVLDHAAPDERRALVTLAGEWLVHSLGGARDHGHFRPRFWLDRLEQESRACALTAPDRDLVTYALAILGGIGHPLRKGPVPRGLIHADFAPHNIFWDAVSGELSVFDIQKTTQMPLGLDIARLLVGLSVQAQHQTQNCALERGVLPEDYTALLAVPGLHHSSSELPFVDFFLGHRLIKAMIDRHDHPNAPLIRRSLSNWLGATR